MTIEQIHFYVWVFFILLVTGLKNKSIWKGVCGGNGIPQSGEFQQYAMVYAVLFYIGQVFFMGTKPDLVLLAFMMIYTATGKIEKYVK